MKTFIPFVILPSTNFSCIIDVALRTKFPSILLKKIKVVSQMLSHTLRRRFCDIVSVMLIVLLLPLGLPQASSDVPVPSVGFLSSWRAGRDPAKHPINQSVVPVPQCQPTLPLQLCTKISNFHQCNEYFGKHSQIPVLDLCKLWVNDL